MYIIFSNRVSDELNFTLVVAGPKSVVVVDICYGLPWMQLTSGAVVLACSDLFVHKLRCVQ